MVAFLLPAVGAAVIPLVQHSEGVNDINRFPIFVHGQPFVNMILGILSYLGVAAVVPLTLFLLTRTGNSFASIGLGTPSWVLDI
jgi:hypothetical protein